MGQKNSQKEGEGHNIRLDKWLWAARFFKTRSLARDQVNSGKVQYNGARCKPSKIVELGALVKVPQGYDVKEVRVCVLSEQRQKAVIAQTLYEELPDSIAKREENAAARKLNAFHNPRPDQKPDKKQRRDIIKFKQT